MPLLTEEEDNIENLVDTTESTSKIKPLPELHVPKQYQVPQQTVFQKYWKFGIAIFCILILLIVLVITVYSINKNPVTNSQVITPTLMPMSIPTPVTPATPATTQSNGFFSNLFGKKQESSQIASVNLNTPTQVPVSVPSPIPGTAFLTNTVPNQEMKGFFGKIPETNAPNAPNAPLVPKVGGGKGKGGKNNKINSKGKALVNSVSSTIKKAIKEMKKIKSGKLIKGGKIMKGGCGCDMQPNLLPNVNF